MNPLTQLFAYPFRIFFLSTAVWAVLAVVLWTLTVSGLLSLPLAHAPLQWHRHEMLFGMLTPAIAGFLLTAVCVWTGTDRLRNAPLVLMWVVWLAGRLTATFGGADLNALSITLNLSFLPLVALDAGWRIVRARQWRQLLLMAVLTLLWLVQAGLLMDGGRAWTNGGLVLAAILMLVVGGRITPAFSANWLRGHGGDPAAVRTVPALDIALLVALGLLLVVTLTGFDPGLPLAAGVAALLALARLALWRGWLVRREPLLWILHLSLLWIPVALLLLAGHYQFGWPPTAWQHALGIGAIGGLILGVMTRVSLGHTGRPMALPRGMVSAYLLIQLAVVVRLLTVFGVLPWQPGVTVTAGAWVLAYALFLWRYAAVLWLPRADGKPG
ncbi:MAG TPA: NnrS family protein [Spongiibacteraceae bacterium]|jgi:uncharacterized protein involved in response to NO|nr:NnrS family protein [Spongiibacteraceae bacterium]